ncbi:DUF2332 domain-containing protein [Streptomyces avermitilis]|uniref:DUF2332 domain-containing protein n=1 Tax=Streptomyces avermitilis TaxID=33903 RepID=UPI0033AE2450
MRQMAAVMESDLAMSASMLRRLADDAEEKGPISRLIGDHPDVEDPLYAIRALAGVRYLVLKGSAPSLAKHLQGLSENLGNPAYDECTWELFCDTLLGNPTEILSAMERPVQQHMPSRASTLLHGITLLNESKIRILEIGACAGLNLLLDQYRWFGSDWEWGDERSTVRMVANGPRPGDFTIVDRAGCDLAPRDAGNLDDATILRSFIPHERDIDQMELDDALSLAATSNLRVEKANAVEWLAARLSARERDPDVFTVVWHSLFWWYLSEREHANIENILFAASRHMRLARIAFEPSAWAKNPLLRIYVYS